MNQKILVVEDESEVRGYLRLALKQHGYPTDFAEDGDEAIQTLKRHDADFSLVLLDIIMPRKDGLDTLREVRQFYPQLPVVMLSGSCSTPHVIQAMKWGADDFLQKPISFDDLGNTIERVLHSRSAAVRQTPRVEPIRTMEAPAFTWAQKLEKQLGNVGESEVPILVRGETGVGKEVLARQLHARSPRRDKPFLKVNCAALPSELVESELFGYERGAFTGAFKMNEGRFKQADGGTIFLDEIGDMDFKLQAKLLQVLQDGEFLRLGSKEPTRVNVRVIAATHCDLEEAIVQGKFREDLYYRLNVINLEIPALRERKDEILTLAEHLQRKHSTPNMPVVEIGPHLRQLLLDYNWPGNIRELENIMRQLLVVRDCEIVATELQRRRRRGASLRASVTPAAISIRAAASASPSTVTEIPAANEAWPSESLRTAPPAALNGHDPSLDGAARGGVSPHLLNRVDEYRKTAEANVILSALNATRWNRRQAADLLKIDYKALLYKMKKLRIGAQESA